MEKLILASFLSLLSLNAFAEVPRELAELVPAGSQSIRIPGITPDGKKCAVDFSMSFGTFSSAVFVYDSNNQMIPKRFAKFQIGFGHELQSLRETATRLTAVSYHEAEESYSSDSRATLEVTRNQDELIAARMKNEEKGFFGFKTKFQETCKFR